MACELKAECYHEWWQLSVFSVQKDDYSWRSGECLPLMVGSVSTAMRVTPPLDFSLMGLTSKKSWREKDIGARSCWEWAESRTGHKSWSQGCRKKKQYQINTLMPRKNGRLFANYIFRWIFLNENVLWISIKISLEFVSDGPINNIPALGQIMAWCRSVDKPLS